MSGVVVGVAIEARIWSLSSLTQAGSLYLSDGRVRRGGRKAAAERSGWELGSASAANGAGMWRIDTTPE
eukprot:scaffold161396_cov30-Tisochrysis_lutea.AAC.5